MKKTLLTIIAVLTMSAAAMAQNVADLVGTYKGSLYISLMVPIPDYAEPIEQNIQIEKGSVEKAIHFALHNFAFMGNPVGDIILNNIHVSSIDGLINFADEKAQDLTLSLAGTPIIADAKINAETSQIKGNEIVVNLDVNWYLDANTVNPIYVRFVGTKKESTGIAAVETTQEQTIYTLNGIRLSQSFDQLPKGIYIVNGKKIIK